MRWFRMSVGLCAALWAFAVGPSARPVPDGTFFAADARSVAERNAWLEARIRSGELRLLRVEESPGGLRHERFQQYHRAYPVFGAQVVRHWKDGRLAWMGGPVLRIRPPALSPSLRTGGPGRRGRRAEPPGGGPRSCPGGNPARRPGPLGEEIKPKAVSFRALAGLRFRP